MQARSPEGLSAAFAAAGIDAVCVPMRVAPADFAAAVAGLSKVANVGGIVVTIPHKFAAPALCATLSERARVLGAVNSMRRNPDGSWHGDMSDGEALVGGARARGGEPKGRRALLVGAGGAGSAIALALVEAGVVDLSIHDSDPARRDALVARIAKRGARVRAGSADPAGFGFVVNASPAGMAPDDPLPVDVSRLDAGAFVACAITRPAVSPFVAAARARGHAGSVGGDMFEAQIGPLRDFLAGAAVAGP